jgi:putative DNA primase/helicase
MPGPEFQPDPEVPFTITVGKADALGKRECVATGPDGEHRDKFDAADAFRREKFIQRACSIAMLGDDEIMRRSVSVYFWAVLRETDGLTKPDPEAPRLVVRRAADIQPERVRWLWPGRLPTGALAILAGDPGLSKSTLALEIAARVTRGDEWPDGREGCEAGSVLILSAEDDAAATIIPRLIAHGADLDKIELVDGVGDAKSGDRTVSLSLDLGLIRTHLDSRNDWRLVIVDPISAYTPGVDTHRNADVRSLLAPLSAAAAERGLCVLAVTHLNKQGGGPAVYRAMGSLAFVAAARVAHLVARDTQDSDRRLLLTMKNNLAPDNDGMAYRVETCEEGPAQGVGRVVWEPTPIHMTADDLAKQEPGECSGGSTGRRGSRLAEAEAWLLDALRDGPRPGRHLMADAMADEGFGEQTIRKAARKLGVAFHRVNSGQMVMWELDPYATNGNGANEDATNDPRDRDDHTAGEVTTVTTLSFVKKPVTVPEPRDSCLHQWATRPSAHDGFVQQYCRRCGVVARDMPEAA